MRLHLGGHLAWYDPQKRSEIEVRLSEPVLLTELLTRLGLPLGEITIAAVNGQAVDLDTASVTDNDRVEVFPPIGGGADFSGTLSSIQLDAIM